jgi:hypothetical protein
MDERFPVTVAKAALLAGTLSGLPSTVHALATRRPLLSAVRAAGTLLGRATVPRGVVAHTAITLLWSTALVAILPRRHTATAGAAAGLGIGLLDLTIARRKFPAIAALPQLPQLLDHIAFGALVGTAIE